MTRKKFLPKDMHDLENIYYDPKQAERKRKYESFIDAEVVDKTREAEAKRVMSGFGESVKISTALVKKPDFKIEERKIVYEITSIQCSDEERITQKIQPRTEQDFIKDVNKALEHALEKDYTGCRDYLKIAFIFVDTITAALCKYTEYSATLSIVKQTIFPDSNVDCIILTPTPSSISEKMAHVAFAKDARAVKTLGEKLPKEFIVFQI
jgi:hypothetical protein